MALASDFFTGAGTSKAPLAATFPVPVIAVLVDATTSLEGSGFSLSVAVAVAVAVAVEAGSSSGIAAPKVAIDLEGLGFDRFRDGSIKAR